MADRGLPQPIRVATRRSQLALTQSRQVAALLGAVSGARVELVEIVSEGDVNAGPLRAMGGTGVFVTAVRQALADGLADVAVHSLKDLPTAADPGFLLAAVPAREDFRDALCAAGSRSLVELPDGAQVGTGSPRRAAQLALLRPDARIVDLRGNVDSRLARVGADLDAVVLAAAGLARLGRLADASELLPLSAMLPAAGQGALAIEVAADAAPALVAAVAELDDPATHACVAAERSLLAALEAGCSAPVGAVATVSEPGYWEPEIFLQAGVFSPSEAVRMSLTGSAGAADELGRELASQLLAAGAAELMREPTL